MNQAEWDWFVISFDERKADILVLFPFFPFNASIPQSLKPIYYLGNIFVLREDGLLHFHFRFGILMGRFPKKNLVSFLITITTSQRTSSFFNFRDQSFELSPSDVFSSSLLSSPFGTIVTSVLVLRDLAFPQSQRELWPCCKQSTLFFSYLHLDWGVQNFLQLQLTARLLLVTIFAATAYKVISLIGAPRKSV